MNTPFSIQLDSNLITSTTIDLPMPMNESPSHQKSIPVPTVEYAPICNFPEDIRVILFQFCDINTIGMLVFTCKTLYEQILTQTKLSSHQLSEICSNLLQQQNLTDIQNFCKRILPQCKDRSVDLIISNPWQELVSALTTINTYLPINSLTMQGKKIHSSDIITVFEMCSHFSIKKLVLTHCILDQGLENVPVSRAIEELQLLKCTTTNMYWGHNFTTEKRMPSLKRFIIQDCIDLYEAGIFVTLGGDDSRLSSSQIEYFSDIGCHAEKPYYNWHDFVRNADGGTGGIETFTNGVFSYYDTYLDADLFLHIDEEDFRNGVFFDYQVRRSAFEETTDYGAYSVTVSSDSPPAEDCDKDIIERLRKSIKASPRFVHSKVFLGQLIANKQPQEAEDLFRESIEIYPEDIRAHVSLGILLLRTNRIQEGIASLGTTASMCKHPSTHLYLVQIIKALIKHNPGVCGPLLRRLIRNTSYIPILEQLKNKVGYHLAFIKYAVFVPERRTEICNFLKEKLVKKSNIFTELVSMQRYNNYDIFTEIEPWLCIFQALKDRGENTIQLLDNFLIVDFQIPGKMIRLFKFLSRPGWKEERQHFLRHLSEIGGNFSWQPEDDINFLYFIDFLLETKDEQGIQELCKVALDICDIDTQWRITNKLKSPVFFQIKKELYYNILRLDSDHGGALVCLAMIYANQNKKELAEKFFKKAGMR